MQTKLWAQEKIHVKFTDATSKFGHGCLQTVEEKKVFMDHLRPYYKIKSLMLGTDCTAGGISIKIIFQWIKKQIKISKLSAWDLRLPRSYEQTSSRAACCDIYIFFQGRCFLLGQVIILAVLGNKGGKGEAYSFIHGSSLLFWGSQIYGVPY